MLHSLYIKNFTSITPCSCTLFFLTLELNDRVSSSTRFLENIQDGVNRRLTKQLIFDNNYLCTT